MVESEKSGGHLVQVKRYSFLCAVLLGCVFLVIGAGNYFQAGRQQSKSLDVRINPNTARLESLIRLPGVGPTRAKAIVEYRKACGGGEVFKNADDLQKIKGIGPKTVEKFRDYLYFDTE